MSDERLATLPNSKIRDDGIVNFTRAGCLRVDLGFTVAYGQDLPRIRHLLTEIVTGDARIPTSPPPEVTIENLTDVGIRFQVEPTIQIGPGPTPPDYATVCSDLREQIATRFDAEGIRLALPPPHDTTARDPTSTGEER